MQKTEIVVIELKASEGYLLTSKDPYEDGGRIFSEVFILAKDDSPENYVEWTIEEAEKWLAEHPEPTGE